MAYENSSIENDRPVENGADGSLEEDREAGVRLFPHAGTRQDDRPPQGFGAGQSQIKPAHPLPARRSSKLDYDRYLERSTDKFKIFSAEERRRRKRVLVTAVAVIAVLAVIVVWAILSQSAA